ncbi:MAG: EutN/CcmL family microcompartment protein [Pseudanabaenaceae cyanobacterium]
MQIARVCGTVVSTTKEPSLTGTKFLLLQAIGIEGQELPEYEVAADRVGAGLGEWVLVSRGSGARQIRDGQALPIDAAAIAIIDTVTVGNRLAYSKRQSDR